jgi:hypothetical protein
MKHGRKRRLAKFFSLPVLALCGFLIAATLAGVGLATGETTSTDPSSTISSTTPPPPPPPTTTTTTPRAREGCTPGFWKNHPEAWERFLTSETVGSVFSSAPAPIAGLTLLQGLQLGGGGVKALTRHGIAALLNAASTTVDYPLTVPEVIDLVNTGYSDPTMTEAIKNLLAGLNEAESPGFCD